VEPRPAAHRRPSSCAMKRWRHLHTVWFDVGLGQEMATMRAALDALKRRMLGPKSDKLPPMDREVRKERPADPAVTQEKRRRKAERRATRVETETVKHKVPDADRICPKGVYRAARGAIEGHRVAGRTRPGDNGARAGPRGQSDRHRRAMVVPVSTVLGCGAERCHNPEMVFRPRRRAVYSSVLAVLAAGALLGHPRRAAAQAGISPAPLAPSPTEQPPSAAPPPVAPAPTMGASAPGDANVGPPAAVTPLPSATNSPATGVGEAYAATDLSTPVTAAPHEPFYQKWWFWTAVGAFAVTAIVIVLASSDSGPPRTNLGNMPAF
jgi:hypothetical protein